MLRHESRRSIDLEVNDWYRVWSELRWMTFKDRWFWKKHKTWLGWVTQTEWLQDWFKVWVSISTSSCMCSYFVLTSTPIHNIWVKAMKDHDTTLCIEQHSEIQWFVDNTEEYNCLQTTLRSTIVCRQHWGVQLFIDNIERSIICGQHWRIQ